MISSKCDCGLFTFRIAMITAIVLALLSGCGNGNLKIDNKIKAYKSDSEALCDAYDPASWHWLEENSSHTMILSHIQGRLVNTLETPEFRELIESGGSGSFEEYHDKVSNEVSSLLGDTWICPAFDDFYLPSITLIRLKTGEEVDHRIRTNDKSVVYAEVLPDGSISLNRAMLRSSARSNIINALDLLSEQAGGTLSKVIIGVHGSAPLEVQNVLLESIESFDIDDVFLLK